MGLKKIFLRYHPPGIVLEYTRQGKEHKKEIDLYGCSEFSPFLNNKGV
jgi:hypothetical protein